MSYLMPESLSDVDLAGRLERVDSEWQSLKGLLALISPPKDDKSAQGSGVNDPDSRPDSDSKVIGFPKPAFQVKTSREFVGVRPPMSVTPIESEMITKKIKQHHHDGMFKERLFKMERQIRQLTFLVIASLMLAMVLSAVLAFTGFKDYLVSSADFRQPKDITPAITAPGKLSNLPPSIAISPPASLSVSPLTSTPPIPHREVVTPGNDHQSLPAAPAVPANGAPAIAPVVTTNNDPSPAATPAASDSDSQSALAPPALTPSAPSSDSAPKMVGSVTSNKIHTPDCKWAKLIAPKRLITFPSVEAGRAQGYVPCPVCRPHENESVMSH
jgi:hypothetical protein